MILAITMNPAVDKVYAIDDYAVGGVFRPRDMTATAGGKGLNVARVAHLLGEAVVATGLIGGSTGRFIDEEVRNQGIDSQFVYIKGETRICINVMDEKNTTSTEILEPGPYASPKECEAFVERYRQLLDKCEIVTASGSLLRGVPVDFYRRLIRIAREKNKKFILDTSGDYFKESIKEKPYMIKPNKEELEKVMGQNFSSVQDYARALLFFRERGIEFPVVTLGKDGCVAALQDGIYHFHAPPIKVLNTVGSGDSFVAGCAVALKQGKEPREVIKLGMACGMANTQFFKTGMISRGLVEKFLKMTEFQKIEEV